MVADKDSKDFKDGYWDLLLELYIDSLKAIAEEYLKYWSL